MIKWSVPMKKISTTVTTKRKSKDSRQSAPFQCNSYNVQSLKLLLFSCYCYQPYRHWAAFLGRYVEWNQALAADDIGDPITMLSNLQIQYYVNSYTKKSLSFHKFWWSEPLPENLTIFAVTNSKNWMEVMKVSRYSRFQGSFNTLQGSTTASERETTFIISTWGNLKWCWNQ